MINIRDIILGVLVIVCIYLLVTRNSKIENFEQNDELTKLAASIKNLSKISDDLTKDGHLTIPGNLIIEGKVIMNDDLDVKGKTTVSKDLKVVGNTDISKDLKVVGNTDISKELQVNGNVDIIGDTSIHGATELSKNLRVHGHSYMTQIDSEGATISGGATIGGILNMRNYIEFSNSDNYKTGLYWTSYGKVALTRNGTYGGTVLTLSSSPSNHDHQGNLYLRNINYTLYNTGKW